METRNTATGINSWGPITKKNRANHSQESEVHEVVDSPINVECQDFYEFMNTNPILEEETLQVPENGNTPKEDSQRPKKKSKQPVTKSNNNEFEEKMSKVLDIIVQRSNGPANKEYKEKLKGLGWSAENPLYQLALGIFCESESHREAWINLDDDEAESWGAVGALDGALVHAIIPNDQQRGRGRGECYQNVLGICDFNMIFTFVWAGWEGVVHDSRILTEVAFDPDAGFPFPSPGKMEKVDDTLFTEYDNAASSDDEEEENRNEGQLNREQHYRHQWGTQGVQYMNNLRDQIANQLKRT
ncbi:hypothetical protein AgCh_038988 [Apium graveolens]